MNDQERNTAYTLRWYITNRWSDPDSQAEALELADLLIGSPNVSKPVENQKDENQPAEITPEIAGSYRVALLVGHNSRSPGAWVKGPNLSESEYVFNNQVANHIIEGGVNGVTFRRFNRTHGGGYSSEIKRVYTAINRWTPDFILDMHFNGGGGDYCFMLHAKNSSPSEKAAAAMSAIFAEGIGARDLGSRSRSRGDRGYFSLISGKAPTVLTEPFFGDNTAHGNRVSRLGHQGIADLYRLAIVAALKAL